MMSSTALNIELVQVFHMLTAFYADPISTGLIILASTLLSWREEMKLYAQHLSGI